MEHHRDEQGLSADEAELIRRARERSERAHGSESEHPARVASVLREFGVDDPGLIAAGYLHDTVESRTGVTIDELRQAFGERVAAIVEHLTLPPEYADAGPDRKHAKLIDEAPRLPDDAKLVKLADRLDNVRHLETKDASKRPRYAELTHALLDALRPWPTPAGEAMAQEIRRRVDAYLQNHR